MTTFRRHGWGFWVGIAGIEFAGVLGLIDDWGNWKASGVPCWLLLMGFGGLIAESVLRSGETRCRKCAHILRGITEPRCPECGEAI